MDPWRFLVELLIGLLTVLITSGLPVKNFLVDSYFKSIKQKNPIVGHQQPSTVRLYSRSLSGYVRITSTSIDAQRSNLRTDPDTLILIESFGPGRVTIRRKKDKKYVCFNKNSKVIIRQSFVNECLFNEIINRKNYVTFRSVHNNTWFLGFSNRKGTLGTPKLGHKTKIGQRSIMFVKQRVT